MSQQSAVRSETKSELKRPKMYKVIILNDDYTTMDFVVEVLMKVFHKSAAEATGIMLEVHEKGKGIAGIYPYDIAATKSLQVEEMARQKEFPLKAGIEEE